MEKKTMANGLPPPMLSKTPLFNYSKQEMVSTYTLPFNTHSHFNGHQGSLVGR